MTPKRPTLMGDQIVGWVVDSSGRAVSTKVSARHLPQGSEIIKIADLER